MSASSQPPDLAQAFQQELQRRLQNKLTEAEVKAFAAELNQLKAEVTAKIGDQDLVYLETVAQSARILELAGRLLIHFSLEPVSWSAGVLCLWAYFQLDNLEIHHHAQHQAWDRLPGAERYHSESYVHDSPVDERSWRQRHNILHHSYTGQVDRDPDASYGFFRLTEMIDKEYYHLVQPLALLHNTLHSDQGVALLCSGVMDYITALIPGYRQDQNVAMKPLSLANFGEAFWQYSRKAFPHWAYNYGLYGLLAGPLMVGKVTLGTLTAMLMRNVFTGLSFYTGHMVEGVKHYDQGPSNRAEWYIQQIEGTANVKAGRLVSLMMGHLNYQIEHHLFPKLPPNRLEEIAPRVEALCKAYGVKYNTGSFFDQVQSVFRRTQQYSR